MGPSLLVAVAQIFFTEDRKGHKDRPGLTGADRNGGGRVSQPLVRNRLR